MVPGNDRLIEASRQGCLRSQEVRLASFDAVFREDQPFPQSTIPLLAGNARLLMELGASDYVNYQVILQTVEGREILRRRAGKVCFGKDRPILLPGAVKKIPLPKKSATCFRSFSE